MNQGTLLNQLGEYARLLPILFALILVVILVVSFRSRAVVFCQYLHAMTGISLSPSDVRRVFQQDGRTGVRQLFLDLIIREDLKEGPLEIPAAHPATDALEQDDSTIEAIPIPDLESTSADESLDEDFESALPNPEEIEEPDAPVAEPELVAETLDSDETDPRLTNLS